MKEDRDDKIARLHRDEKIPVTILSERFGLSAGKINTILEQKGVERCHARGGASHYRGGP